ncbi:unnamed protein product [Leptosia nina]|uniref:Uncharacterized protein n=1 Tax=Leptosia nina TaxID=320188 RepID=A0AAV1JGN7_9NEOP
MEWRLEFGSFYCQDPDTYKLYPVNATWPSKTFCGNYTCKLRKKNQTEIEYMPMIVNITKQDLHTDDMSTSPSYLFPVIKKLQPDKRPVYDKETLIKQNERPKFEGKNDRYLTEAEIKSITDVLHTVRKSDLEAIIEIYNLAQEIYKEMDGATTESLVKETVSALKEKDAEKKNGKDGKSYFYKPLHQTHTENLTDMIKEGTRLPPFYYPSPLPYYNGPVVRNNYGRMQYYYPMSNFQRSASYNYNRGYPIPTPPPVRPCTTYPRPYTKPPTRPCSKPQGSLFPLPWNERSLIKPYVKQQRSAGPMLLPYPFSYVHHYNYSSYPPTYYYNHYPWAQLDTYKKKAAINPPQIQIAPDENSKVIISKERSSEEVNDGVETDAENEPDWKSKPLSEQILDEVRANILDKSKLLKPLRKNVKLERVGKVIKLDKLKREKRSLFQVNSVDDASYEVYLETTKCEPSTDPGFFRVGNMSAPFPECCPQKIR